LPQVPTSDNTSPHAQEPPSLLDQNALSGHLYLNHSNWFVRQQILHSVRFWLQQGIRGFYLTNLHHLQYNTESPEHVIQLITQIRSTLDQWSTAVDPNSSMGVIRPILMTETRTLHLLTRRMRNPILDRTYFRQHALHSTSPTSASTSPPHSSTGDESAMHSLHSLFDLLDTCLQLRTGQSESVREQVNELFLDAELTGSHRVSRSQALWSVGSHRTVRISERFPFTSTGLPLFVQTMLPGAISIFYGDEIAQKEPTDSHSQVSLASDQLTSIHIWYHSHSVFFLQRIHLAQLAPMAWSSYGLDGEFSGQDRPNSSTRTGNSTDRPSTSVVERHQRSQSTQSWLPQHPDALTQLNVQKQQEGIIKLRQLLLFRRQHLIANRSSSLTATTTTAHTATAVSSAGSVADSRLVMHQEYLFHYVNQGLLVFERHLRHSNHRKRFVLFANLANESRQTDFSEKFYFGTIKLASNLKRLRDFLFLNALHLEAGEALIAQIE
jgi:glycosidase